MTETSEPVAAAADALQIAEDTLSIARESEQAKDAALARAKEAEEKLVELQKVASDATTALDNITDFLRDQGWLTEENYTKYASEMKSDPTLAVNTVKRILEFSEPSYDEGAGIPKGASEESADPNEAALARERALWAKVAAEGA